MAIKFKCPHCKKALIVNNDSLAGKKAHCNGCKKQLTIPKPAAASAPAEDLEALAASALGESKAEAAAAQETQTIDFECPQCGEAIQMSREFAGKNAPCPECRRIIKVPMPKTKDPADWRQKDATLPSGARRDTEPAPEGAWEPSRARAVSAEALTEAGVIPKKKKPGLTRQQKITRGVLVGVVLLVVAVGGIFAYSAWARDKQDKLVEEAVKTAESHAGKSKEAVAEANRAAGEFFIRTQARDAGERAQKKFAAARAQLEGIPAGPGRDALLTDLLLSQIDLSGSDAEATSGSRLKAKAAQTELTQTLSHVSTFGGRMHALHQVSRRLIERDRGDEASQLAGQSSGKKTGEGDDEGFAYEGPEALAVVGLEFLRAKEKDKAALLAERVSKLYAQPEGAKVERLPLAPSAVALCLAVGKTEPKPGKARDDKLLYVIGLALKGDPEAAHKLPEDAKPEWRFRMLAALAEATGEGSDLDNAVGFLDGELSGKPVSPWLVYRLVELAAQHGQIDRALKLTERISDPGLKARAQLEGLRARLAATKDRADDGALGGIDSGELAQALAREALARHNARRDGKSSGSIAAADGLPEPMRSLAILGAILGEQDAKGK
jgi:hypothetical protein